MKIPVRLLKDSNPEFLRYKYHVESPAAEKGLIHSLEFIVGPTTSGGIIDRFLKLHFSNDQLKAGGK